MAKFQIPTSNTFRDMNYFLLFLVQSGQMDRQTESDAYEPTVQFAQVGSIIVKLLHLCLTEAAVADAFPVRSKIFDLLFQCRNCG